MCTRIISPMEWITLLIDFVLHVDQHLNQFVTDHGAWIYLLLFAIIFVETGLVVMPFLPGDSLLFVAGALAAMGQMNVHLLVALLIVAAILGDGVNYTIGRHAGMKLFARFPRLLKQSYLDKTHAFYEKHGGKTIIFARFVPIVRTFAPFVAGIGRMEYRQFLSYNVIGALLWVIGFSYAGFFFGNMPFVRKNLEYLIFGIIIVSMLPGIIEVIRHRRAASKS